MGIVWIDFDRELAIGAAALLLPSTPVGPVARRPGLSGLTRLRNARAVTTDRAWAKLDLGVPIGVVR